MSDNVFFFVPDRCGKGVAEGLIELMGDE